MGHHLRRHAVLRGVVAGRRALAAAAAALAQGGRPGRLRRRLGRPVRDAVRVLVAPMVAVVGGVGRGAAHLTRRAMAVVVVVGLVVGIPRRTTEARTLRQSGAGLLGARQGEQLRCLGCRCMHRVRGDGGWPIGRQQR
jgi:hypothetical protein